MQTRLVRTLLRRISLGLPLAVGPLVVGASSIACTHCYTDPAGNSTHPRSPLIESLVGTAAAFDPTRCDELCRMLDFPEGDAGSADVGPPLYLVTPYPERAQATCAYFEDGAMLSCSYSVYYCETSASCSPAIHGRAPAGLISRRSHAATPVARWLADGAHLEAASVSAFEDVAAELRMLDAPSTLIAAARRSANDERRHARQMSALAGRLGAPVKSVQRELTALRAPDELALDNAVEGCVHEAYAAFAAALQAEHASSAAVRSVFRSIAADEARHALLSFAANDWLAPRVSAAARRRAEDARRQALEDLAVNLASEPEQSLKTVLGLPDATRSMDVLALVG